MPDPKLLIDAAPADSCAVRADWQGSDLVLTVTGEVDLETCDQFGRELRDAVAPGRQVSLDLDAVEFMDSTGLNAVIQAVRLARDVDGSVVVRAASPRVDRLFKISGLAPMLYLRPPEN